MFKTVRFIFMVSTILFLTVFILQNSENTTMNFLFLKFEVSMIIPMVITAGTGFLAGVAATLVFTL